MAKKSGTATAALRAARKRLAAKPAVDVIGAPPSRQGKKAITGFFDPAVAATPPKSHLTGIRRCRIYLARPSTTYLRSTNCHRLRDFITGRVSTRCQSVLESCFHPRHSLALQPFTRRDTASLGRAVAIPSLGNVTMQACFSGEAAPRQIRFLCCSLYSPLRTNRRVRRSFAGLKVSLPLGEATRRAQTQALHAHVFSAYTIR